MQAGDGIDSGAARGIMTTIMPGKVNVVKVSPARRIQRVEGP